MSLWVSLAVKAKVRPEERQRQSYVKRLILTTVYSSVEHRWEVTRRESLYSEVEGRQVCNYVCRMTTYDAVGCKRYAQRSRPLCVQINFHQHFINSDWHTFAGLFTFGLLGSCTAVVLSRRYISYGKMFSIVCVPYFLIIITKIVFKYFFNGFFSSLFQRLFISSTGHRRRYFKERCINDIF